MSNKDYESDDALDLVRSMRDTIRDITTRAEVHNASIRDSFSGGFLNSIPGEPEDPETDSNEKPSMEADLGDH